MRRYIALAALALILPFSTAAKCEKNPDCTDGAASSAAVIAKPECKIEHNPPIFVPGSPAPSKASPGKAE